LIACQLREQLQLAQRRIDDPVRRALLEDVADRDAQRRTQREHSGDIHLVHGRFLSEVEGGSQLDMLGAPTVSQPAAQKASSRLRHTARQAA
jgi:hypothetical protein